MRLTILRQTIARLFHIQCLKYAPILGTFHSADLIFNSLRELSILPPPDLQDYIIQFVNYLDPNGDGNTGLITWPKYTNKSQKMSSFDVAGVLRPPWTITEELI
ncbi:hypothetical protein CPB85DRAFT_1436768 [Mucidula mucida]|nr:hypothetical protein CPB85DRAFT_1436768 [Mucidula mucida]